MVDNTCDVHVASIDRSREATEALGDARSMDARSRVGDVKGGKPYPFAREGTRDDAAEALRGS